MRYGVDVGPYFGDGGPELDEGKLEHFELERTRVLDARVVLLEYRTTN